MSAALTRRAGTCATCAAVVSVDAPAALHPPKHLTVPCPVCRWPLVLAPVPAVVHEVVPGTEANMCRTCGTLGHTSRCCSYSFVDRTVLCACGARARWTHRAGGGDYWRCESHLPEHRVEVAR